MISNKINTESVDVVYNSERILAIKIKIKEYHENINIVNVYGPNTGNEKIPFIDSLYAAMNVLDDSEIIVGGDFNIVFDNDLDVISGARHREEYTTKFRKWADNLGLKDVWRHHHKNVKYFTWSSVTPFIARRLDYFFLSENWFNKVTKTYHEHCVGTDHKSVIVELKLDKFNRGSSYWKFNDDLLLDDEYVDIIINMIDDHQTVIGDSKMIHFEILKAKIKAGTISYGINKKRNTLNKEKLILENIDKLTTLISNNPDDKNLKMNLEKEKHKVEIYNMYKAKGAQIRSRVKYIQDGEKNSKYFFALESNKKENNIMKSFKDDDGVVYEENKIIEKIKLKYENLYKKDESTESGQDSIDMFLNGSEYPVLDEVEREFCDKPISLDELDEAIKLINLESAPGYCGLSSKFWVKFWEKLKIPFYESLIESINFGELTTSQRRGIITLIPKGSNLPRNDLNNWRPITLTSTDYRIITKVLASRLQKVITSIIGSNQYGFIKGRNLSEQIRLIDDVINHYNVNNGEGCMVSLDFRRAFDTIEKESIIQALKKFNFGPYFINIIMVIMKNTESSVQNGGWISGFFKTERGIRQGCSVSPILFIIVSEILSIKIRENNNIRGLQLPTEDTKNKCLKILSYADDMTLFANKKDDVLTMLEEVEKFGIFSGLKLNRNKSNGMWLGANKMSKEKPGDINWVENGQYIKILGIYFCANKEASLIDKNWVGQIDKIKSLIKQWHKRNLSLYGKIVIAKTFLLSQITHIIQSLALPETVVDEIDTIIFKFLWQKHYSEKKANEKLKRSILCSDISDGGLKMISVKTQHKVFLMKWMYKAVSPKWNGNTLINYIFSELGGTKYFIEAPEFNNIREYEKLCKSNFWTKVAQTWSDFRRDNPLNVLTIDDILMQPLFNNQLIKYKGLTLFFKSWFKKGIIRIKDIIKDNSMWKNFKDLKPVISDDAQIIFQYNAITNAIPKSWRNEIEQNFNILTNVTSTQIENNFENLIHFLTKPSSDIRHNIIIKQNNSSCGERFWKRKLGVDICSKYNIAHIYCTETRLRLLHFKICHNIWPTNITLNRMKIVSSENCNFCREPDYVEYFFIECTKLLGYWEYLFRLINSYSKFNFKQSNENILFGINREEAKTASKSDLRIANSIILIGKMCVSKMRYGETKDVFLIFEMEWSLRRSDIITTDNVNFH